MISSIASAIDSLISLVDSEVRATDPDVDVLDGPDVDDVGRDVIAIGISGEDFNTDADVIHAGLGTHRETYDLICMVRSWSGDSELAPRRLRAFQLFHIVSRVVRSNPQLNGTVAHARISSVTYAPARLPEGAVASVTFRVRIDAFTS